MSEPWLARHARQRPDARALDGLTYAELHRLAAGADPGPYVGAADPLELAVAVHARWLRGEAAIPVDPRLTETERARRLGVRPPRGTALTVFTSGTTAHPKPVHIGFDNLYANAVGSALALGLRRDERWLCPLPLSHVGGLMVLARSLVYGTTALLGGLDRLGEATIASVVPTQVRRVLEDPRPPAPELRCLLVGGAPLDPALRERALKAGLPVVETYGLTEATSQVTIDGWPLPGTSVTLADDGEILVSGPTVAGGGVLRTGDLGRMDARGRLTVVGRKTDIIVSGGENVAPAEVEAALLAHPDVADALVFGRADPEWGEAVTARVVLREGASTGADDLRAWCSDRLARYKVPKAIELVEALPRTSSGKLVRRPPS